MSDLNALIAQGAQFAKPVDPFAQYAQMQQLEQGQQANALNRMKMDKYKQETASQNAMNRAYQSNLNPETGDINYPGLYRSLAGAGAGSAIPGVQKEQAAAAASKTLAEKNKAAAAKSHIDNSRELLSGVASQGGWDAWRADAVAKLPSLDAIVPKEFSQENKDKMMTTAADVSKRLTLPLHFESTGGNAGVGFNPTTGAQVTQGVPVTMTPAQIKADEVARGQLNVSQGQLKVAQGRLAKEGAQLDPLENQVLAKAIAEGRVDINKVNGRNAKIYVGALRAQPGVDLREMSFENTASAAGARSLGVQSAKMRTAAIEADKMIDIVRTTSASIDRTQFPTVNAIQNAVDKGTGGKEIVQLNTAINSLVNSYARAISPTGQPTVSDKNHAREVINSSYSNGQIDAITDIMRQEMDIAKASTSEASAAARTERQKKPGAPAAPAKAPPAGFVLD